MNEKKLIEEFHQLRALGKESKRRYQTTFKHYKTFTKKTLPYLLNEADDEEEQGIRLKNRKIKRRLLGFQNYLESLDLKYSAIDTYMAAIKTFYRAYEIEVPNIKLKEDMKDAESIDDIPSMEHLECAIKSSSLRSQALIYFMMSSGCASKETRSLTIEQFLKRTEEYHQEEDPIKALKKLQKLKGVIPTFYFARSKTNYPYYTFCSPEAVQAIATYLLSFKKIRTNYPIFKMDPKSMTNAFKLMNNTCNFGKKNGRNFLTSHKLRKFFATQLIKEGLDFLIIEWMLGHSINKTTEAYFKADPEHLKKQYIKVVNAVSVHNIKVHDVTTKEYMDMKNKNKDLSERIAKLEAKEQDDTVLVQDLSNLVGGKDKLIDLIKKNKS